MTQKVPVTMQNEWTVISGNTTATTGLQYLCNTTSAAFTLTLPPTPAINAAVSVADYASTFATNKLTIGRNSSNIMGLAEDMDVTTNNASFTLVYSGDATKGWRII